MKTSGYIVFIWVVAGLFLVGAVGNIFAFWGPRSWENAAAGLLIAVSLFYYGWFFRSQLDQIHRFQSWLVENQDSLRSGTAFYGDSILGMDTQVSQYIMVVSLIKVCLPIYSRPFIRGKEDGRAFGTSLLFTLGTLLLGWWEIPWGPIHTVKAVYRNLRGGRIETVGSLLAALSPSEDQSVFVHLEVSAEPSVLKSEIKKMDKLLKGLIGLVHEKRAGAFQGYGPRKNEYILRFYGPDADRLFAVLEKPLRKSSFRQKGFAVKHYGRIEDSTAREVRVSFGEKPSNEGAASLIRED